MALQSGNFSTARLSSRARETQSMELERAADEYRSELLTKADRLEHGVYPMWYGWALRDAFMAGYIRAKSGAK